MKNIFIEFFMLCGLFFIGMVVYLNHNSIQKEDTLKPYSIRIIDDHEIRLIKKGDVLEKGDTIFVFFENASVLSEETIVFVKQ